jgi:putative ABC transport system ATP-binding protein
LIKQAAFGGVIVVLQKSTDQVVRITDRIIARDSLTAMMVTHSMQQAVTYGDRLVMMHRGQIIHDVSGAEKRRLRVEDLLARFEEVRRADLLDTSAADLLRARYI